MSDKNDRQLETPESAAPTRTVSVEELQRILEQHDAWLRLPENSRASHMPTPGAERADLSGADLRGALLVAADLREARLANANLRETNLTNANLEGATGLLAEQLAGAKVTGARLSPDITQGFTETLGTIEEAAKNARKLLFGLLLACGYSWLTIATTSDLRLLTNTASSPLPIVGTEIAIAGFYWAAPAILLGVYLYLQFSLQHLWEILSTMPAVLQDGVPLDRKAYPWVLTGLIRAHVPYLREERSLTTRGRVFLATALVWWVVPATLAWFWWRYLSRHHWAGSMWHVVLVIFAVALALGFQRMARVWLRLEHRGQETTSPSPEPKPVSLNALTVIGLGVGLALLLWVSGAAFAEPFGRASLREAQVSGRPANYALIAEEERNGFVAGADLRLTDLRNVDATGAFLENADLSSADLTNAILSTANLRTATLFQANLTGADLTGADLTGADLTGAALTGATLEDALLRDADLTGANLERAVLRDVVLTGAKLEGAVLTGANLEGTDLSEANLRGAILRDAALAGAKLEGAVLRDADLTGANLEGTDLTGANLEGAILRDADLTRASLPGVFLRAGDLAGAILRYADLEGALLVGADLRAADLRDALLNLANLIGANLTNVDLTGANLTDAILRDADLGNADLSGAILINTLPSGGITQQQLNQACGDDSTTLPAGLTIPGCQ